MKRIRIRAAITLITIALYTFGMARVALFFENPDLSVGGSLDLTLAGMIALFACLVIMVVALIRAGLYHKKKNPKAGLVSFLFSDTNESYEDERERLISATATRQSGAVWQTIMAFYCLYVVFSGMATVRVLDIVYVFGIAFAVSEIVRLFIWEKANR